MCIRDRGTPTLDQYSRDLTEMARQGVMDPVVGREDEIGRVIQILSRRTKNNPCLIGEPAVAEFTHLVNAAVKFLHFAKQRIVFIQFPIAIDDRC